MNYLKPFDPAYCVEEERNCRRYTKYYEGVFAQGSGYLQIRGSYEEGLACADQGELYMRMPANVTIEKPRHPYSKWGVYVPGVTGIHPMLKEELEVVSAYCVIQNYRYKDKVSVNIEVPDSLKTAYVPKNILQPLVENAIYHGIAPMEENGTVEILAERREEMLDLWVIDTGIGMDENELKGLEQNGTGHPGVHSIGIKSIRERLEYLYQEHYSFEIYSEKGKGTTVLISIPYQEELALLREAEESEGENHEK